MRYNTAVGWGLCGAVGAIAAGMVWAQGAPLSVASPPSASLTLGGDVVLTLRAAAGGLTPQQRVDAIDGRLSDLLGIPHIHPSDVAVYTPAGKAPVIYALGRRLITVDAATAKSEGEGKTPLALAEMWAKKLQQVLPRVNYRPSNEPEPVIPPHPPLRVTADLAQVGGNVGYISLRNKVVFKIVGPQTGGLTAQERALLLTRRIQVAANKLPAISATDIVVASMAGSGQTQISVGATPIIAVDAAQAKASGFKTPEQLADAWAKNVRTALGLSAAPATAATATTATATTATAPAATVPAATVPAATVPAATVPAATVPAATTDSVTAPATAATVPTTPDAPAAPVGPRTPTAPTQAGGD